MHDQSQFAVEGEFMVNGGGREIEREVVMGAQRACVRGGRCQRAILEVDKKYRRGLSERRLIYHCKKNGETELRRTTAKLLSRR